MALDFYKLGSSECLFSIGDEQLKNLSPILETFHQCTGIAIDAYNSIQLTTENCKTLVQIGIATQSKLI